MCVWRYGTFSIWQFNCSVLVSYFTLGFQVVMCNVISDPFLQHTAGFGGTEHILCNWASYLECLAGLRSLFFFFL